MHTSIVMNVFFTGINPPLNYYISQVYYIKVIIGKQVLNKKIIFIKKYGIDMEHKKPFLLSITKCGYRTKIKNIFEKNITDKINVEQTKKEIARYLRK